jgi:hypothetical protein
MNFTYTLREPPDRQYGSLLSDNSWNGMVGLLANQTIDVGKNTQLLIDGS